MIDNKMVGRKISSMRQESGMTQQQLAAMMNVSHQAVSKWESGQALPDIQIMLELTRFFGITVEQLITDQEIQTEETNEAKDCADNNQEASALNDGEKEKIQMNIQQLLQMAPYMSRETVEEIAMEIDEPVSSAQIARIAAYLRPESVEALIEKHHPDMNWELLRKIAPYLRREYVDGLAKDIAGSKENAKPASESINKAFNDIGKAFDDVGREMGHAVKKGLRFGKRVIREVSSAINDFSSDLQSAPAATAEPVRSERAAELRRKVFELALEDEKWDWIAAHMDEAEGDKTLRDRIAAKARECEMHDWICKNMGGYADEAAIEAAIASGNWNWLGENTWQLEPDAQERIARFAIEENNWQWLSDYSDQMNLKNCGYECALAAMQAGEDALAAQLAENHLLPEQVSELAEEICRMGRFESLELFAKLLSDEGFGNMLIMLSEGDRWDLVGKYAENASAETVETLMERAVEKGSFDAIEMLYPYL